MRFRFGAFTLDVDQRRLLTDGEEIPLTPKAFELLKLLLEHRPKALSKDEILRHLWKGTFVSENNLATVVRDLRAALQDDPREPQFIRTAYGFGYAFSGSVTTSRDPKPQRGSVGAALWRLILDDREVSLCEGDNILGRQGPDVVVIDSPTVSRHHARLTIEGESARCVDLNSKNGTWVNGTRASRPIALAAGDELRLGSVVLVVRRVSPLQSTQTVDRHRR
jgi:DNA-binding winged helix-turn-helix (wHTH) protein